MSKQNINITNKNNDIDNNTNNNIDNNTNNNTNNDTNKNNRKIKILIAGLEKKIIAQEFNILKDVGPDGYINLFTGKRCWEGGPDVGMRSLIQALVSNSKFEVKILSDESKLIEMLQWCDSVFFQYDRNLNLSKIPKYLLSKIILSPSSTSKNREFKKNIKINFIHSAAHIVLSINNLAPHSLYLYKDSNNIQVFKFPIHQSILDNHPISNLKTVNQRDIDCLIYQKIAGSDTKRNNQLYYIKQFTKFLTNSLRKENKKVDILEYGNYYRRNLIEKAKRSKVCLVLSYYDTGGLAQMEISCMGCYMIAFENPITRQHSYPIEWITDGNGCHINELSDIRNENTIKTSISKIMNIIRLSDNLNSIKIAQDNRLFFSGKVITDHMYNLITKS